MLNKLFDRGFPFTPNILIKLFEELSVSLANSSNLIVASM